MSNVASARLARKKAIIVILVLVVSVRGVVLGYNHFRSKHLHYTFKDWHIYHTTRFTMNIWGSIESRTFDGVTLNVLQSDIEGFRAEIIFPDGTSETLYTRRRIPLPTRGQDESLCNKEPVFSSDGGAYISYAHCQWFWIEFGVRLL